MTLVKGMTGMALSLTTKQCVAGLQEIPGLFSVIRGSHSANGQLGEALVQKIMANLSITIVLFASIALPGSNCLGTRNAPSFYRIGVQ